MKSVTGKFVDLHEVNVVISNKMSEVIRRQSKESTIAERDIIKAQWDILNEVRKEIMTADGLNNSIHLASL